ncbi:putative membrane protein [Enterococcus sp. PF1-24]|uniref:ECF transporter S component n=1 Tax=unclassified Enterococcus TaxID=2608891 RepID=UPI002473A5F2|nr:MULTISPECIES: ECF transporter S component [unclassified Enterococcus]MDH6363392.1 putative membrane protein [Enterococcus sp. PFB1-1]MDH6400307.1 putative membrane protein [Enterococcus sp. PF1-24]
MNQSTKKIALLAMLLALCVVGANIKILGSIAFDSFPAFVGAFVLGPLAGAFLGFFGHMISAMLSGFPQTLPLHLLIGVIMGLCMLLYGWVWLKLRKNKLAASVGANLLAYFINVPFNLLVLYPIMGAAILALFMPLTMATVANLVLAEVVILGIPERYANFAEVK